MINGKIEEYAVSDYSQKSTVADIRRRFEQDNEVERFSNLVTGQTSTMDAPLALELIAESAARVCPQARDLLDVGCGAGNYSLKLLQVLPGLSVTLVDLSQPMLDRALQRVRPQTQGTVRAVCADIRGLDLQPQSYDLITAAAVFHHLRDDGDWVAVFSACYQALRPGGCLWISDLVAHEHPAVQELMWRRYGEYLSGLKGPEYRDGVFAYIDKEDTPRSLTYQVGLLHRVGFQTVEILHKNGPFAAFGGIKAG